MKQNLLNLLIGISINLCIAGNAWAIKVFQCVNTNNEVSFSGQPCGEGETLVKEHDIQSNLNILGPGSTQTSPQNTNATVASSNAPGDEVTSGAPATTSSGGESGASTSGGSIAGGGGSGSGSGGTGGGGSESSGRVSAGVRSGNNSDTVSGEVGPTENIGDTGGIVDSSGSKDYSGNTSDNGAINNTDSTTDSGASGEGASTGTSDSTQSSATPASQSADTTGGSSASVTNNSVSTSETPTVQHVVASDPPPSTAVITGVTQTPPVTEAPVVTSPPPVVASPPPEPTAPSPPAAGEPYITEVSGTVFDGQILTIKGYYFGEKTRDKPYFFWSADEGGADGSALSTSGSGAVTGWLTAMQGEPSIETVAPGSMRSVKFDHSGSNDAILGGVEFNSDLVYLWRKTYDAFTHDEAQLIITHYGELSGPIPLSGQVIKGRDSGATGIIGTVNTFSVTQGRMVFSTQGGTVAADPPIVFLGVKNGGPETLDVYENDGNGNPTGPVLATMKVVENWGTDYMFNDKIVRFWYKYNNMTLSEKNNMYYKVGQGVSFAEYTGTTSLGADLPHLPYQWTIQEVLYKTSTIDMEDGIFWFIQNGEQTEANLNKRWRFRTTDTPNHYRQIFQHQVSNGAQPGTDRYFDALYIEDSWHHVVLCNSPSLNLCEYREIQLPTSWSSNLITVKVRTGSLDLNKSVYLFIFDGDNKSNSTGFQVM